MVNIVTGLSEVQNLAVRRFNRHGVQKPSSLLSEKTTGLKLYVAHYDLKQTKQNVTHKV